MNLKTFSLTKNQLIQAEYQDYYNRYLDLLPDRIQLKDTLFESEIVEVFSSLTVEQLNYRYAEGKWTPKQILQHITDVERIFTVRALRISRGDQTELPGFNIDEFASNDNSSQIGISQLINDYQNNRASTISLYESISEKSLSKIGQASGGPFSVRVIPFILKGHEAHHISNLNKKYSKF
jgi:hypothetical protein